VNKFKSRLIILFFVIILTMFVVSCSNTQYKNNGERIYFTATSSSGKSIFSQGSTMMQGNISCVDCHGADGHGGNVNIMMDSFEAPNITWTALTGSHEDHVPFTETTIKDAITKGIDPSGQELESYMPIWQMADEDLNDLIGFLKTLK